MVPRKPLSLVSRSTIATLLVLIGFLGITGFALDRAYTHAALEGLRAQLQSYAYTYLAGIDVSSRSDRVIPPDMLPPNPDFGRPGSGLYAVIVGQGGFHWEAQSALGRDLPFDSLLPPGPAKFEGPVDTSAGPLYVLSQGIEWMLQDRNSYHLTIYIAENDVLFHTGLAAYRRTLFGWLAALGLALLVLQQILLRWSFSPLRRVARDIVRIERGGAERLVGPYPREVSVLTRGLNRFIESEREHLSRYRNTLDDLAHSLKTPLAVARSRLESTDAETEVRGDMLLQVQHMDQIVAYQLARAKTSGHSTFAAPIPVQAHAEAVVRSLERVYAGKNILCEFDIDEGVQFYGEEGDLLELLGNLLENAFKWASHRVLLSVKKIAPSNPRVWRVGLDIRVEDDGPGIPQEQLERVLQRGVRGDERVQGHGIGLAIVEDIVRAYRGSLQVDRSTELGGACFHVSFAEM
ncbi:MAG: two-component sensor histidine kinase [Xanthomonadales bacterium]|nr:two-component sensor histidine kinase [Xanthomonadales bacterium]ODU91724.1 MAG: two-component sensor histidine kinase [Rhodanobacter sp. SCN 66-43]OJY85066.1 MAG: two-component sensor histidine kinase [Xanthomonadales bacterium 66-474]